MKNTLISITIPVYNNLKGLELSLQSVLVQTYTNWEVVVVDDGSVENHKKIVDKFNDDRIRFYRFDKNKGRAVARQKTFEMMQGKFCAFLDAGDCYEKNFLENAIHHFAEEEQLLGVSQTMKIVYKNKVYCTYYDEEKSIDIKSPIYQKMAFASTIIKTNVCKDFIFDSALKHSEDRYFLNHLAINNEGRIMLLNTNGYIYNQNDTNAKISTTFKKYHYDSLRLVKEKRYFKAIIRYLQTFGGVMFHVIFGYEKILEKRYGHSKKGVLFKKVFELF